MDPEEREVTETTTQQREIYAERAEIKQEAHTEEELQALALAYARYLANNDLAPGEATFVDPDELLAETLEKETPEQQDTTEQPEMPEQPEAPEQQELKEPEENLAVETDEEHTADSSGAEENTEDPAEAAGETAGGKQEQAPTQKPQNKGRLLERTELSEKEQAVIAARLERSARRTGAAASAVDLYDRIQTGVTETAAQLGRDFIRGSHRITSTYRQSRRTIGTTLLIIGIVAAVVLAIFDNYTVYEYAYNGKILGYVKNQEDVTGVLDIAGAKLTENSSEGAEIRFVANQNVTFNLVDGRDKSIDDSDMAVNKLVYLTDIETEAYGVYDGDNLAAIVKSAEDAEELLNEAMAELSRPDGGMKVISSEYTNELAIQPVNVLLTSVQSNEDALQMMTAGGSTQYYHIVEAGETIGSIARTFGVDRINIYDESNQEVVTEIEQGDKVCIHKENAPVSVKMVEEGKMREIIEYETIKKESDEYYEGDTHTEQEGKDQVQIFSGKITKVGGEVTDRDEENIDVLIKGQDKIILIGTAERPRTAPTGTYLIPLERFTLTSNFGWRWGRLHSGIDMGIGGGTPIMATDGGTVIRASWYSGYGNCVDIDHGNGRVTRYGHCSRLLVNVGDQVYQGQTIALVGNTGHSFGNHLHFEIILNGTPVNPRPYLGI